MARTLVRRPMRRVAPPAGRHAVAAPWSSAGCWGSRPGCCSRPPSPDRRAPGGPGKRPAGAGGRPGHPGRAARRRRRRGAARARPARRPRRGAPLLGAAGVASREGQTPLRATDRFRLYSIAKTFTAIVVLQLADAGVLSLDDPVRRWLDAPAVARIPHTDRITLRQLLTHTSGIYDYQDEADSPFYVDAFFGPGADWSRVWAPPELLAYADGARHAPYFAPGQGVAYANTNYVLLGLLVEAARAAPSGTSCATGSWAPWPSTAPPWRRARPCRRTSSTGTSCSKGNRSTSARSTSPGPGRPAAWSRRWPTWPASPAPSSGGSCCPGRPRGDVHLRAGGVGGPRVRHGRLPGADAQRRADRDGRGRGRGHLDHDGLPGADVTVVALANAAGGRGLDAIRDEAFAWALAQPAGPPAA